MASRSPWLARIAGDPLRAGDLYYQQGRLDRAAAMYRAAGRFSQAAKVLLEMGDRAGALALYLEGNDHLHAGELLALDGNHKDAVVHFESAKAWQQAAESSLALKQDGRAARYFERAGVMMRAAAGYEKAGELDDALRVLERESRALSGRFRVSADESVRDQLRVVDGHRASLLGRLNRWREAAEILLVLGLQGRAGEAFEKAGEVDRAIKAWLEAGQPERVLPLLSRATQIAPEVRADVLRRCARYREAAEIYSTLGRMDDAAECWDAAGETVRAAPMFESLGEPERAAEIYARAERWRDAARCYATAGKMELAARMFERADDQTSAAACYAEAGRHLDAAKAFLAAGDPTRASRELQQIPEGGPDFERATLLLIPMLVDEGLFEGALHRLDMLPQDPSLTGSRTVERQYWEGRALEGAGRLGEAIAAYQKTIALRRDFQDAATRLEALRKLEGSGTGGSSGLVTGRIPVTSLQDLTPPGDLKPGMTLAGRYKLLAEIGRGGMGRVYKAEDSELGDVVALKTLLSTSIASGDQERLVREVQICRRITHPNVVRVFDLGRFPGGMFVTMEYLEGRTLDVEMRERGQLPFPLVKDLLSQMLAGLQEAHQLRVIHRDLKPSNVILTAGRVKILDFGIARQEGHDVGLTVPGEVLGSPKYMSPEQIQGEELDGRSDLYALGILAYAMLAGREPFVGKTASAIAMQQLRDPPPDIQALRPDLPPPWKGLLDRLLDKRREQRFADAAATLEVVRQLPA